jgi:hypothetical protein
MRLKNPEMLETWKSIPNESILEVLANYGLFPGETLRFWFDNENIKHVQVQYPDFNCCLNAIIKVTAYYEKQGCDQEFICFKSETKELAEHALERADAV